MTELQKKAILAIKRLNLRGVLGTRFGLSFDKHGFAVCPFHTENKPSFHVRQSENENWRWRCFGCGESGDYIDFRRQWDNVNFHEALRLICSEEHIDLDAGYPVANQADSAVAFTYTDTKGIPLYRVKKIAPKRFYFERFAEGRWLPGLAGVSRTLYNLPALLDAKEVFLLEGEKDCETVRQLGFVATTMGSKNSWKKEFAIFFKDKDVNVCLDVGNEADAERIAKDIEAVASNVRILKLPGLEQREQDITDWLEKMTGQPHEEKANSLRKVVSETPARSKPADPSPAPLAESIADFQARAVKERDIFMRYWLEREGLTILAGEQKTGKSLLALNLAISVALGREFLGFEVPLERRVLLIEQEISTASMKDRIGKMLLSTQPEQLKDRLFFPTARDSWWKLTRPADRTDLALMIRQRDIDLVIFDPLSTFHDKKENDNADMGLICEYLAGLMRTCHVAVFVVHHFGKPSQEERYGSYKMRGASILGDRPDAIITSTRLPEKYQRTPFPQPFENYAQLKFTLRNDEAPDPIVVERNSENLWYRRYDLPGFLGKKILPSMVAEIVRHNGGSCLQTEVMRALEEIASRRIAFEAIAEARRAGLVKAQPLPGKGSPLLLVLPENFEGSSVCEGVA